MNLSVYEPGLPQHVGGLGVVQVLQAFFEARVSGISVTLWQVADRATSTLMQAVYQRMETEGEVFDRALTAMKRAVIAGDYGRGP